MFSKCLVMAGRFTPNKSASDFWVKGGRIEIQGNNRAAVARILTEANFQPMFSGG